MLVALLLLSSVVLSQTSDAPAPKAPNNGQAARAQAPAGKVDANTPERVLRTFLVAIITQDEKQLQAVTVPSDDFAYLLKGRRLAPEQIKEATAQIAKQPIRVLKPGDVITLPNNRKVTVQPYEVTDDLALLLPEGVPVPTRLRKVDGRWKVDPAPIIAARKAAESARKKGTTKSGR